MSDDKRIGSTGAPALSSISMSPQTEIGETPAKHEVPKEIVQQAPNTEVAQRQAKQEAEARKLGQNIGAQLQRLKLTTKLEEFSGIQTFQGKEEKFKTVQAEDRKDRLNEEKLPKNSDKTQFIKTELHQQEVAPVPKNEAMKITNDLRNLRAQYGEDSEGLGNAIRDYTTAKMQQDPDTFAIGVAHLAKSDPGGYLMLRVGLNEALAPDEVRTRMSVNRPDITARLKFVDRLGAIHAPGSAQVKKDVFDMLASELKDVQRPSRWYPENQYAKDLKDRIGKMIEPNNAKQIMSDHPALFKELFDHNYRKNPELVGKWLSEAQVGNKEAYEALMGEIKLRLGKHDSVGKEDSEFAASVAKLSGPGTDVVKADLAMELKAQMDRSVRQMTDPNDTNNYKQPYFRDNLKAVGGLLEDPKSLKLLQRNSPRQLEETLTYMFRGEPDLAEKVIKKSVEVRSSEVVQALKSGTKEESEIAAMRLGQLLGLGETAMNNALDREEQIRRQGKITETFVGSFMDGFGAKGKDGLKHSIHQETENQVQEMRRDKNARIRSFMDNFMNAFQQSYDTVFDPGSKTRESDDYVDKRFRIEQFVRMGFETWSKGGRL